MKTENLYIHTIGCQMNVYDSDRMAGLLMPLHYTLTDSPESADLVVVNTCAIRAKAEQKVFSYLGRLARLKRRRPGLIIAVGGCVAQQEGSKILERIPSVDLVFGTHAINRLPDNITRIKTGERRIVDIDMLPAIEESGFPEAVYADGKVSQFVTIMQGCDNYCTYCVVPYVRGREASRQPERIIKEIQALVKTGVREVTLLGQNVNSYGIKEGVCTFPELLARVNAVDGLLRIRFTTSHPKDLSEALIQAFGSVDKLCHHIHLPVQSGSNRILKRMNRRYTRELYLEKIDRLRHHCPDIAITSDFIVGFPGETEDDFRETLDLIRAVGFDGLFAFMYSDRPHAPAARFSEKIPEQVKGDRLQKLLDLQETINTRKNESLIGSIQTVLVDGFSKKQTPTAFSSGKRGVQWTGRTSGNKIVHFVFNDENRSGFQVHPGEMIDVEIERAFSHSLWGIPLETQPGVYRDC